MLTRKIKTTRGLRIAGEPVEIGTVLELKAHEAISIVASNKAEFVEDAPVPPEPEPQPEPEPEPEQEPEATKGGKRK